MVVKMVVKPPQEAVKGRFRNSPDTAPELRLHCRADRIRTCDPLTPGNIRGVRDRPRLCCLRRPQACGVRRRSAGYELVRTALLYPLL